jgi:hypothetical protein
MGQAGPFGLTDPAPGGGWLHRNMREFPMAFEPDHAAAAAPTEIRLRKTRLRSR